MSPLDHDPAVHAAVGCVLAGLDVLAPPELAGPLIDAATQRAGAAVIVHLGADLPAGALRPPRRADAARWLRPRDEGPMPPDAAIVVGVDGPSLGPALPRVAAGLQRLVLAPPTRFDALAPLMRQPVRVAGSPPSRPRVARYAPAPGEHPLRALTRLLAAEAVEGAVVWLSDPAWVPMAAAALDAEGHDVSVDADLSALQRGDAALLLCAGDQIPSGHAPLVVRVGEPSPDLEPRLSAMAWGRADGLALLTLAGDGQPIPDDADARRALAMLTACRAAAGEPTLGAVAAAVLSAPDAANIVSAALRALLRADRQRRAEVLFADDADPPGAPRRKRRRKRRPDIE